MSQAKRFEDIPSCQPPCRSPPDSTVMQAKQLNAPIGNVASLEQNGHFWARNHSLSCGCERDNNEEKEESCE